MASTRINYAYGLLFPCVAVKRFSCYYYFVLLHSLFNILYSSIKGQSMLLISLTWRIVCLFLFYLTFPPKQKKKKITIKQYNYGRYEWLVVIKHVNYWRKFLQMRSFSSFSSSLRSVRFFVRCRQRLFNLSVAVFRDISINSHMTVSALFLFRLTIKKK